MKRFSNLITYMTSSFFVVLNAGSNVAFAITLKFIIDSVSEGVIEDFYKYLLLAICVMVFEFTTGLISKRVLLQYVQGNLERAKNRYYSHTLFNEDESNIDEVDIAMFSTNANILSANHYMKKVLIIKFIAQFIFSVYAMIKLSWVIFIVTVLISMVTMIVPQIFQKRVQKATDKYALKSKEYLSFITDSTNGIDEIRGYNNQSNFIKIQEDRNKDLEKSRTVSKFINSFVNLISETLNTMTFLSIIALSGYYTIQGDITLGTMMAIIQLLNSVLAPVNNIVASVNSMNSAKNIVKKYEVDDIGVSKSTENQLTFNDSIVINNLSYSYDTNKRVIEKFSCKFENKKKYAIVGPSGAGKSTLAKIIAGNIKNYSGSILVDGKELSQINISDYREECKYIKQQPYVFKDTIKNNISFFDKDKKSILSAMKLFNLKELINEIGLDKVITDKHGISGGQKQRIALSRALVRKPPILVMDEPTSSLDHKNTKDIIEKLLNMKDITLIMVTHEHDQELLSKFDEIIEINKIEQITQTA